jgi:hypothetical protein
MGLAIREKGSFTEAVIVIGITKVGKIGEIWDVRCGMWDVGGGHKKRYFCTEKINP